MKKKEIYVVIDSEEKRLRALRILEKAGEKVFKNSFITKEVNTDYKVLEEKSGCWGMSSKCVPKTQITLDQLEQLLTPYTVKEVHLNIDELKQQAEKLGFDLVEKKREIKVGDFGLFGEKGNIYDFLKEIKEDSFRCSDGISWDSFRHLTDEEKEKIQNNW